MILEILIFRDFNSTVIDNTLRLMLTYKWKIGLCNLWLFRKYNDTM